SVKARLLTTLPVVEALRLAAEFHPGIRVQPPEGGVLRECLRRHGLVPSWVDLPSLVPELAPTAAIATGAIKAAEGQMMSELAVELSSALYQVSGRRCQPLRLLWDPARIFEPAPALARLLGRTVKVGESTSDPPQPEPHVPKVEFTDQRPA